MSIFVNIFEKNVKFVAIFDIQMAIFRRVSYKPKFRIRLTFDLGKLSSMNAWVRTKMCTGSQVIANSTTTTATILATLRLRRDIVEAL